MNKTQRDYIKNKDEKIPPLLNPKNKKEKNIENNYFELGKIDDKKEKVLLTTVKTTKHKKFFIQTEDPKRKYKKKYINVNFNNNKKSKLNTNLNTNNNSRTNLKEENINNKIKSRNKLEPEKNKKLINKNMNQHKKCIILQNKTSNNKLELKFEDSNSNNIDLINNKNIANTLSRNISFHGYSKKLIHAPKKLVSSTMLKIPQKSEIIAQKNKLIESNDDNKLNIIKSKPEQINQIIEFKNNNFNNDVGILINNQIIYDNSLKYNNNFFDDNNNDIMDNYFNNYFERPLKEKNSNSDLLPNQKSQIQENNSNKNDNSLSINFEDLIIYKNIYKK